MATAQNAVSSSRHRYMLPNSQANPLFLRSRDMNKAGTNKHDWSGLARLPIAIQSESVVA